MSIMRFLPLPAIAAFLMWPTAALASEKAEQTLDLTSHWAGYASLTVFVVAYFFVMVEEFIHLRKSKPVMMAAGIIWGIIAVVYAEHGIHHLAEAAVKHNIEEYAELMLFLLVAMTYINVMQERQVFGALRCWLIKKGFGYRKLFWATGVLAFFISPVADNLTTALLMAAVVMAVGADNTKFVTLSCINIVVAANAGGAFSPFGDITTLMVWQKGLIGFGTFFLLFVPAAVNFIIPAAIMHFAVPKGAPAPIEETVPMKRGALVVIFLFVLTIVTAVSFHQFLWLPPVLGMMTGLGYLKFFGYYLKVTYGKYDDFQNGGKSSHPSPFDIFDKVARAEWDTLFFFYGVILCVGGLGTIGYLELASHTLYVKMGATFANVMVGFLSSIVDNIPVMYAVLTMNPDMTMGHWLLVTLTAGVGGSMLSIGSAAGVALMGATRGKYTFFQHLKWMPVILLGYAASVMVHLWINADQFHLPPHSFH